MRSQGNRLDTQIRTQGDSLDAEIKAQGNRFSEVLREQARANRANGVLSEVIKQQSHTHGAGD